ncbi:MAG: nuclear transport factor 2 family protein [Gammaproteobacteria bacterium]|nr:nuclear transport factor 2 family protein [Gammaproteobacteria bacterium]
MRFPVVGLLLFGIAATSLADPETEVRCREIAFSQSAENRDIDAFKSFLDDDARFVGNGALRGPEEIAAAWQVFFDDDGPRIKWRPQFVEVLENGKLALTRGPYEMVAADEDGNPAVTWGTFNSVWRLHADGYWRVVFDAGSPASGEPDETARAVLDAGNVCQ